MREATARLDSGKDASRVALAGYEEPEAEVAAGEVVYVEQRGGQSREFVDESPDAEGDDETPAPVKPSKKRAMRHILEDEE
jgi:hypothetical protein